nr:hypothetical protein KXZ65_00670 [Pectobacterium sp. PL152]
MPDNGCYRRYIDNGGGTAGAAAKLTSAGISMGINGTFQGYQIIKGSESEFSYTDFLMSGATGWLSAGAGITHSALIGVNTAYIGSSLKGEDPTNAMLGSLGGSLIGFGAGKLIEAPLKPIFNNVRNEYGDIPVIYP